LTFTVRFRRTAELEIQEAQSWYEEQQAGLAEDFNHEVNAVMAPIPFPGLDQVLGSVVLVLACTHGRADPRKVKAKLR
jgi:hypothetical protein